MDGLTPATLRHWLMNQDPALDAETLTTLEEQKVDLKTFIELELSDMLAVGIKLGPAKRLVKIIKGLNIPTGEFVVAGNGELIPCPDNAQSPDLIQDSPFDDEYSSLNISDTESLFDTSMPIGSAHTSDDERNCKDLDWSEVTECASAKSTRRKRKRTEMEDFPNATQTITAAVSCDVEQTSNALDLPPNVQVVNTRESCPKRRRTAEIDIQYAPISIKNTAHASERQNSRKLNVPATVQVGAKSQSNNKRKASCNEHLPHQRGQSPRLDLALSGSSTSQRLGDIARLHKRQRVDPDPPNSSTSRQNGDIEDEENRMDVAKFTRYASLEETIKRRVSGGERLVQALKRNPSNTHRRRMVRILVDELVECHGKRDFYPQPPSKIALARQIVIEFPLLKHPKGFGYQHFFNPQTNRHGYIEQRLWNARKELEPEEKKNKPQSKSVGSDSFQISQGLLLPDELHSKKSYMSYTIPDKKNKESMRLVLKETYADRRTWILTQGPSISMIRNEYGRLFDWGGVMIDDEFDRLHPGCSKKYKESFTTYYVPRILGHAKVAHSNYVDEVNSKYQLEDDSFKALYLLQKMLPSYIRKKKSNTVDENESDNVTTTENEEKNQRSPLVEIVPDNNSIETYMDEKRKGRKTPLQPYLVRAGSSRYFVEADGFLIKRAGKADIVLAFDLLFKSFEVLNVEYPNELSNFYNFVACHIYGIDRKENPSVASLFIDLTRFNLEAFRDA